MSIVPIIEKDPTPEQISREFRDNQGRFRTRSLFKELNSAGKFPFFFTLKDFDEPDAISMKRRYLEIADPTEYEVAEKLLGSWRHWLKLCEIDWFQAHLEEWRRELRIKLKSQAVAKLKKFAGGNDGLSFSANRYFAEQDYDKPTKGEAAAKRGRPSKHEVNRKLKEEVENSDLTEEDAKRLGIT